jgi:hypothetical protein
LNTPISRITINSNNSTTNAVPMPMAVKIAASSAIAGSTPKATLVHVENPLQIVQQRLFSG